MYKHGVDSKLSFMPKDIKWHYPEPFDAEEYSIHNFKNTRNYMDNTDRIYNDFLERDYYNPEDKLQYHKDYGEIPFTGIRVEIFPISIVKYYYLKGKLCNINFSYLNLGLKFKEGVTLQYAIRSKYVTKYEYYHRSLDNKRFKMEVDYAICGIQIEKEQKRWLIDNKITINDLSDEDVTLFKMKWDE